MRAPKLIAPACAFTLALGGTSSLAAADVAIIVKDAAVMTAARGEAATATDPRPAHAPDSAANGATVDGTHAAKSVDGEAKGDAAVPEAATAGAQQQQAQGRKKQNIFLRVISAPFRGLARLFGDGGGRKQAARIRVEETPRLAPSPAAATPQSAAVAPQPDAPRAEQRSAQQLATVLPQPAPAPVLLTPAPSLPAPANAAPASNASNASAPSSAAAARESAKDNYEPAPFMPLIVGVPRDPLSQGRALLEHGYLSEAIAELSVAAVHSQNVSHNLVEANNLLGLAYDRRGWHKQAREAFERALSIAPADPHVLSNLGYSLYLDDRYAEALGRLKQAARLAPGNPHIHNNLALVYGRLQKYGEAYKHFERAGGELHARLQTGSMLEAARRDHEAIKHYEAARRLDPASAEALRRLIPLYNRTGQREKAEAARRELDRPNSKSVATS